VLTGVSVTNNDETAGTMRDNNWQIIPSLTIPVEDLDKIVDGTYENLKNLESDIVFEQYLRAYLPALDWWIDVTRALAFRQFDDGSGDGDDHN
jgi:hypothetical protein